MSAENFKQRASDRFDETGGAPENAAELEAWEDFALIADHLERTEVVALPADFQQRVQHEISQVRQAQWRRDLVLVLQTALVTGTILILVAATALGWNWWDRLFAFAREPLATHWATISALWAIGEVELRPLRLLIQPFLRLLPGAFLVAAIAALLLEIAVFRLLRIGPFRLKPANPQPSTPLHP